MTTTPTPERITEAITALRAVYDDLYPVGDHKDSMWGSSADYLEWFADIVGTLFGDPPVDPDGYYTERNDPT